MYNGRSFFFQFVIASMEKKNKETNSREKTDKNNQPPQSIAERLLQQCLIPVPVQPLPSVVPKPRTNIKEDDTNISVKISSNNNDSNTNNAQMNTNWFKCKICNKTEQTQRLLYHASHAHNIHDLSVASRECVMSSNFHNNNKGCVNNNNDTFKGQNTSNSPSMDFHGMGGGGSSNNSSMVDEFGRMNNVRHNNENQQQSMNSPPWCEGAFPSDLEDVALSPPSSYNGNTLMAIDHGSLNCGVGFSNMEDMHSSSCSPPSVGDLTSLNPQDHFDPDFDVVDEMKFIDCLIQTIEPTTDNTSEHHSSDINNLPLSNSAMDQGAHDDAVSSEEDTKPNIADSMPRSDSINQNYVQSSIETNPAKNVQLETTSQDLLSTQHNNTMRHYPKLGGMVTGSNGGLYPTSSRSCMVIGGPPHSQSHMSPMQSQFKFGHSNTINVSFSNSKILFPHPQQPSVVLPPPMPTFLPLPSSSSSRINASPQASNPFSSTSLKSSMNPVSSNSEFILSKMSSIPSTASNGKLIQSCSVSVKIEQNVFVQKYF